jgi:predicted nuclease of predicted toxin-antitoxin system
MKIVLDMNIPEVWEEFLRNAGHEAIHWSRIGDIRADDDAIMAWAREHGHVVFTHDLDFGSLLFTTNATAPRPRPLSLPRVIVSVGD